MFCVRGLGSQGYFLFLCKRQLRRKSPELMAGNSNERVDQIEFRVPRRSRHPFFFFLLSSWTSVRSRKEEECGNSLKPARRPSEVLVEG